MLLVSFVHGYKNDSLQVKRNEVPCLLSINPHSKYVDNIIESFFPRSPEDFFHPLINDLVVGELPDSKTSNFTRLPRFGLMGLACSGDFILAASWNGIYKLHRDSFALDSFISNRMMNDLHGICVIGNSVFSVLTSLDTIVETDIMTGKVINHFSISQNLEITVEPQLLDYDWRFIGKQHRGAVGFWHFNHITYNDEKLLITSRLTNSVVEVCLANMKARLRTVCWDTPVMIHDGRWLDGDLVFTSVDGKILICNEIDKINSDLKSMEFHRAHNLMRRDLVNKSIRLGELQSKTVNWCRGIEFFEDYYITTTEGRYDQYAPFFNVTFVGKNDCSIEHIKVPYELLEFPDQIKYMTGFAVQII